MKITRKRFLQLSGLSLIAIGAEKLVSTIVGAERAEHSAKTTRWGMAIDLQKCHQKEGATVASRPATRRTTSPNSLTKRTKSSGCGSSPSKMCSPSRRRNIRTTYLRPLRFS